MSFSTFCFDIWPNWLEIVVKWPFIISKFWQSVSFLFFFSNLQEDSTLHPRDISDLPYIGLQCQIPESPWISLEIWKMTIQALSHPLWFPMLCLAFTPILAFVLIGWEVKAQNTGISQ